MFICADRPLPLRIFLLLVLKEATLILGQNLRLALKEFLWENKM
jgi:hypothetical protein